MLGWRSGIMAKEDKLLLSHKANTDILIIGGGIAGTTPAYYLAKKGNEVPLLERSELATEASGLNAGTLWQTGGGAPPSFSSTLGMGGLEILKTLQFDLGYDLEFRQSGALKAIQTEEQLGFYQKEIHDLRSKGYTIELLTTRDARSLEPELSPELLCAMYSPLGGTVNPVEPTRAFASAAHQHAPRLL